MGGKVLLSEGSFDITATIVPRNDLVVLGAGLGATRLVSGVNGLKFFEADNVANDPLERACFSDFTMDGASRTEQCAIDLRYALGCTFPRLRVIDMPDQTVLHAIAAVTLREYTSIPRAGSSRNHIGSLFLENVERGFMLRGYGVGAGEPCEGNVIDALYVVSASEWGVAINYSRHNRFGYVGVVLGANNAVGFYFNKDIPDTAAVAGNSIGHLFVDSAGYANCEGVNFYASRQNVIGMLSYLPFAAFNGTLVEPFLAESYKVVAAQPDRVGADMTHYELRADGDIVDPGDAGWIPAAASGHIALVTGGGGETRSLPDAAVAGLTLDLYMKTHGGGNCVVTATSDIDQAGNNVITFNSVGDFVRLVSIEDGADYEWRVAVNDGAVLS